MQLTAVKVVIGISTYQMVARQQGNDNIYSK